MSQLSNRTFDEIALGTTETVSRTLTTPDVEALALAAGDVEGFHLEGGTAGGPDFARRARRPSRSSPASSTDACPDQAARSSAPQCATPAPARSATR